jgi:hypothetical protein
MPAKGTGLGSFVEIDAFGGGVGWLAHPDEVMERAGHALVDDGDVWVVDPVDAEGLDDRLEDLGRVRGVVVLYNYHRRDASAIATRHDVPVLLPAGMTALADDHVAAPVRRVEGRLGDSGYFLRPVTRNRVWQEWALFDGETLVVAESLGTADYFLAPGERLGVSLARRPVPPGEAFGDVDPARVLCGHGEGVAADAAGELRRALEEARRTAPRMYLRHAPTLLRTVLSATLR